MVLWCTLLLLCMLYEFAYNDRSAVDMEQDVDWGEEYRGTLSASDMDRMNKEELAAANALIEKQRRAKQIGIVLLSISVSFAMNFAYVYTVLYESLTIQSVTLTLLVIFKFGWLYMVVIPSLKQVNSQFNLTLAVMVANVIVIPIAATMAVDIACYNAYFVEQEQISTDYTYEICNLFGDDLSCIGNGIIESTVSMPAPIVYSHQCFAALLTNCKCTCVMCTYTCHVMSCAVLFAPVRVYYVCLLSVLYYVLYSTLLYSTVLYNIVIL